MWRIIGSVAARHWFADFNRVPLDVDLLTPAKITGNDSQICVVDCQWHDAAEQLIEMNKDPVFLDPDLLFTLKVSHAHWDVKWRKTMFDIHFLQQHGCKLNMTAYHALFKVWTAVHGKKRVNMAQPMTEFFNDAVPRQHDHEHLHELVKFYERPLHESMRKDLSTAFCSEDLFNSFSEVQQYHAALEEMMVTAIERYNLTSTSKITEKLTAMSAAHFKLCTSMSTGWFARFLILNQRTLFVELRTSWMPKLNTALQILNSSALPIQQHS